MYKTIINNSDDTRITMFVLSDYNEINVL